MLLLIGYLMNQNPETYDSVNMAPGSTFAIITAVVYIFSLFSSKTKEEELHRKQKCKKVLIGQKIMGILLCASGSILSMVLIPLILWFFDKEVLGSGKENEIDNLFFAFLFGIVFLCLGVCFMRGVFNKTLHSTQEKELPLSGMPIYDNRLYQEEAKENSYRDVSMLDGMNGFDFEYFCADLLSKRGFFDVSVTKSSGDQGVDVLATKDGIKYAIQCKNFAAPLSNTPVQEVFAGKSFYNCHVGVVMTNSVFTPGARSLAEATGVLLWDRDVMQRMLTETRSG